MFNCNFAKGSDKKLGGGALGNNTCGGIVDDEGDDDRRHTGDICGLGEEM